MKYIWMHLVALCLSACSTPEYMETKNYCAAIWNKKIPEKIGLRVRDRTRIEERPTGKSTCWFNGRKTSASKKCVAYTWIIKKSLRKMSIVSNVTARYNIALTKNAWRIMATKIAQTE